MYYFFSFLSFLNSKCLPSLHKSPLTMDKFNKRHFVLLAYKYWVTKNYLKHKK